MNVATRALSASQLGLDVTGQNIANADTEGYSRKRVDISADYRFDPGFGQIGIGVNVVSISRIRDTTIDTQIQRQSHELGYYSEKDDALLAIENILNEPSDTGISSYMDKFFDSWNNLTNNPSDLAARTAVKTAGQTLTDTFHNISTELQELRSNKNTDIAGTVETINNIAQEIFQLNKEISGVELADQNANDSRDRRDVLMKRLAGYVEYDTLEDESGQVSVSVGGNIFISPVSMNLLELNTDRELQDGSNYILYGIKIQGNRHPLAINGGSLKGLMDTRDITIPKFESVLDQLALELAETMNAQHQEGYNLNGYTGFDFFDPTLTGAADISVAASVLTDLSNIAAAKGGTQSTANANIITAGDMNFGNSALQLSKQLNRPWINGTDNPSQKANNVVKNSLTLSLTSTGAVLQEGTDFAVNYTSGTVQMLHNGFDNLELSASFDYTSGNFSGPGNNENALKIAALRDKLTMAPDNSGKFTSTFAEFYASLTSDIGLERTAAISNRQTRDYLIQQYEDSQESIAGVSLDEEMSNLIKYQHTYQASAKIVATAQQMLDILMNI